MVGVVEEITVTEVALQEGQRDDGSKWTRWKIKDDKGRTLSTFDENLAAVLQQGSKAKVTIETKELGPGRKVNNVTSAEAVSNGAAAPAAYTHQTPQGEPDWDKVALGKTRCALWNHFLAGHLASSLYAKAVSETRDTDRDPMEYVLITGTRLVVAAERDIFERAPGQDAIPFNGKEVH